jgi:ABC-2 type transport system ATP-binding protein
LANILELQAVSKTYDKKNVLSQISFSIPKGSIFGLLGQNGAGKTTLIRILAQITASDCGKIYFNQEVLAEKHQKEIGYLPEERGLYKKMKVKDQLLYLSQLKGLKLTEAKSKLNYWAEKFDLFPYLEKPLEALSKGWQQKVQFLSAILHEPSLVILDEPFTGFDPQNAQRLVEEIQELNKKGTTFIISTHRMEMVEELCNEVAFIHQSHLVKHGNIDNIKQQEGIKSYWVEAKGYIETVPDFALIISKIQTEHICKTQIEVQENKVHDLLIYLISIVEIKVFKPKEISLKEIFIKLNSVVSA